MQGSTSPLKNGWPACSQRQFSLTRTTARRTRSHDGSIPKSQSSWSVGRVEVQGWPFSARQLKLCAGKHAPPAHWPSSPCKESSLAPQPSVVTRARSAAMTSAGAWTRSRNTCQRMAGSESSSQSITVIGPTLTCWQAGKGLRHGADRLAISPEAAANLSSSQPGNEYGDQPMVTKGHKRSCGGLSLKLPGYRATFWSCPQGRGGETKGKSRRAGTIADCFPVLKSD